MTTFSTESWKAVQGYVAQSNSFGSIGNNKLRHMSKATNAMHNFEYDCFIKCFLIYNIGDNGFTL